METEIKWMVSAFLGLMVMIFCGSGFSAYLTHKERLACIEAGGSPAEKTCIYGGKNDH